MIDFDTPEKKNSDLDIMISINNITFENLNNNLFG